jgi:uncharacterized protein (UPF0261 family)
MESLIASGMVGAVLDITTTEWADELVGGVLTAGPQRLEAAARHGVPAIVSTGCLDMVNFGSPETVPTKFQGRRFYQHNPQVTLMRTTPQENHELGCILARKLNLDRAGNAPLPLRKQHDRPLASRSMTRKRPSALGCSSRPCGPTFQ